MWERVERAGLTAAPPAASDAWNGGWPAHRAPSEGRRWRLFLSRHGDAAREAAEAAAGTSDGAVFGAPPAVDLPLLLHELEPLPEEAGVLFVPDLHLAFPCRQPIRRSKGPGEVPPAPAVATPAYVLARLTHLGAGERDLAASAEEGEVVRRAVDLLQGRGAACQFEVVRPPDPPSAPAADSGPGALELAAASDARAVLRVALHAPDVVVRAKAAEAGVRADPENPVAHLLLGCSLAERRKPAEAANAFRESIERDSAFAAAHFELGKTMIVLDDLEAALGSFTRATAALPAFGPAWANMGASLGELERPGDALAPLERAAELDPLSHSLASNLGVTLRELDRLPEAEAAFRRSLELAPDFVFGRYNLANAVYLQGRHQEAVGLFEEAVGKDPTGSARQKLLLAAARLAAGDESGAVRDYRAVFDELEGQMRLDMRTVAQWDLRRLAERAGLSPSLRRVALMIRDVGQGEPSARA